MYKILSMAVFLGQVFWTFHTLENTEWRQVTNTLYGYTISVPVGWMGVGGYGPNLYEIDEQTSLFSPVNDLPYHPGNVPMVSAFPLVCSSKPAEPVDYPSLDACYLGEYARSVQAVRNSSFQLPAFDIYYDGQYQYTHLLHEWDSREGIMVEFHRSDPMHRIMAESVKFIPEHWSSSSK